jgi:hypothetical protein
MAEQNLGSEVRVSLQTQGGNCPKKSYKSQSKVKQAELLRTEIPGYPYTNQQSHTHAKDFVKEQPTNIVKYSRKPMPVLYSVAQAGRKVFQYNLNH